MSPCHAQLEVLESFSHKGIIKMTSIIKVGQRVSRLNGSEQGSVVAIVPRSHLMPEMYRIKWDWNGERMNNIYLTTSAREKMLLVDDKDIKR